jgi:hypothetical protein
MSAVIVESPASQAGNTCRSVPDRTMVEILKDNTREEAAAVSRKMGSE